MKKHASILGITVGLALALPFPAAADLLTFTGTGANAGLSATADITLLDATTLKIVLTNTSTSLPASLSTDAASNQLLTTLAFQLPGNVNLVGGKAAISTGSTGPSGNLSTEWGWGWAGSGLCCELVDPLSNYTDWVSTKRPGTVPFATGSLDKTNGLSGPDYGLVSNSGIYSAGDEAIRNSATFTLSLSGAVPDLSFLARGAVVEFGSDAAFLTIAPTPGTPEPAMLMLVVVGAAGIYRRRRTARTA